MKQTTIKTINMTLRKDDIDQVKRSQAMATDARMKNENKTITVAHEKIVSNYRTYKVLKQGAEWVVDDSKRKMMIYQYTSSRL